MCTTTTFTDDDGKTVDSDRHEDNENAPPLGDRTVSRERSHDDDR